MLQRKTLKVNLSNTREREKKERSYNKRTIETESGSFTPLVFVCNRGRLADLLAIKKNLNKSTVMVGCKQNCRSNYYAP